MKEEKEPQTQTPTQTQTETRTTQTTQQGADDIPQAETNRGKATKGADADDLKKLKE